MNIDEFKIEVKKLGIEVTDEEISKLEKYADLLKEWNEKINLTAITEKEQMFLKHFYDSLTLVKIINLDKVDNLCDLGTGAGFPGLVLKIFFPQLKLTLVDALNKRINFLDVVVKELFLENVTLVHARAEEYGKGHRECFDVVTARALSSFPILLEYSASLLKVHGHLIAMRGLDDSSDGINALKVLNLKINNVLEFKLPFEESNRTLVDVIKVDKTPQKYPRRYAEIKKKTL